MLVTRKSPLTGITHTMDLDCTQDQLNQYAQGGVLIQRIFPNLNDEQREFIQTGYTQEDWDNMFPPEEQ